MFCESKGYMCHLPSRIGAVTCVAHEIASRMSCDGTRGESDGYSCVDQGRVREKKKQERKKSEKKRELLEYSVSTECGTYVVPSYPCSRDIYMLISLASINHVSYRPY